MKHSVISEGESQRNQTRDSRFMGAKITFGSSAVAISTVIRNLSAGGAMIDSPAGLKKDDYVVTHLRNLGEVPGKVAWVHDGRAGVTFDFRIDPDDVRSAIKRTGVAKPIVQQTVLSPLTKGSVVEVNVPGVGILRGTVEWLEDKRMSLTFERSLLNFI